MAFFHKRCQRFFGGRLTQHAGEDSAFFRNALAHSLGLAALHQALGFDQRRQGLARQLLGLSLCHAIAFVRGHHAVDQTHFQCGFSHEGLAQQQRLGRSVVAQHLRQQQAGCGFGADTQIDEGQRKGRVVARINQVAMQQQRCTNAYCRATNGGNQWLGEGRDFLQKTPHRGISPHGTGGRCLLEKVCNIVARAEDGDITLEHHHAHARIGLGRYQRIRHLRVHGFGEGVFLCCAVEGDGANALFGVHQNVLVILGIAHGLALSNGESVAGFDALFLVINNLVAGGQHLARLAPQLGCLVKKAVAELLPARLRQQQVIAHSGQLLTPGMKVHGDGHRARRHAFGAAQPRPRKEHVRDRSQRRKIQRTRRIVSHPQLRQRVAL